MKTTSNSASHTYALTQFQEAPHQYSLLLLKIETKLHHNYSNLTYTILNKLSPTIKQTSSNETISQQLQNLFIKKESQNGIKFYHKLTILIQVTQKFKKTHKKNSSSQYKTKSQSLEKNKKK